MRILYNYLKRREINLSISSKVPIFIILSYLFINIILNRFKILNGEWTQIYPQLFFLTAILAILTILNVKKENLGIHFAHLPQNFILGFIISAIPYLFILLVNSILTHEHSNTFRLNYSITYLIVLIFAAPVIEETFFRGLLFSSLRRDFNLFEAILISSFIFMLTHLRIHLGAFALGVTASYLFYLTNSVLPGIILHSMCNLLGLVIVKYMPDLIKIVRIFGDNFV